jgi:hypothetical protein
METESSTNDDDISKWMCEAYYNSDLGGKDIRILFAMAEGNHSEDLPIPLHTDEPFCYLPKYKSQFRPDLVTLQGEVKRRHRAYGVGPKGGAVTELKSKNWSKPDCLDWLSRHKIPKETFKGELLFLQGELLQAKASYDENIKSFLSQNVAKPSNINIPFMRLYHVFLEDKIKGQLTRATTQDSKPNVGIVTEIMDKFIDSKWAPDSFSLPTLHSDFAESMKLYLTKTNPETPNTVDSIKKRMVTCLGKMARAKAAWEQDGSGKAILAADPATRDLVKQQVYQFTNGDDRKDFMKASGHHILYLWQILYKHDIMYEVCALFGVVLESEKSKSSRKRKSEVALVSSAKKQAGGRLSTISTKNGQVLLLEDVEAEVAPPLNPHAGGRLSTKSTKNGQVLLLEDVEAEVAPPLNLHDQQLAKISSSIDGLGQAVSRALKQQHLSESRRRKTEQQDTLRALHDQVMELELRAVVETVDACKEILDSTIARKKKEIDNIVESLAETLR